MSVTDIFSFRRAGRLFRLPDEFDQLAECFAVGSEAEVLRQFLQGVDLRIRPVVDFLDRPLGIEAFKHFESKEIYAVVSDRIFPFLRTLRRTPGVNESGSSSNGYDRPMPLLCQSAEGTGRLFRHARSCRAGCQVGQKPFRTISAGPLQHFDRAKPTELVWRSFPD